MTPADAFFETILLILNVYITPVIFSLAFIVFFWGVYQYFIAGAADEEKRKKGRNFVLYGIIGFVLIFSLWGIINLLMGTFGLQNTSRPALPGSGGDGVQGGGTGTGGSSYTPPDDGLGDQCSASDPCTSPYVCQTGICRNP